MTEERKDVSIVGATIAVAIPAYDGSIPIKTAGALMGADRILVEHGAKMAMLQISGCSLITKARNSLLYTFKNQYKGSHLLMLDSDIVFEPEHVARLAAWAQTHDVVAAVYPTKDAHNSQYFVTPLRDEEGNVVWTDDKALIEVHRAPAGFMMVRDYVVDALFERWKDRPYKGDRDGSIHYAIFDQMWTSEGYMGEDYLFCDRVRELGFRIFVDPAVNLIHVGKYGYKGDFANHILVPEEHGVRKWTDLEPSIRAAD